MIFTWCQSCCHIWLILLKWLKHRRNNANQNLTLSRPPFETAFSSLPHFCFLGGNFASSNRRKFKILSQAERGMWVCHILAWKKGPETCSMDHSLVILSNSWKQNCGVKCRCVWGTSVSPVVKHDFSRSWQRLKVQDLQNRVQNNGKPLKNPDKIFHSPGFAMWTPAATPACVLQQGGERPDLRHGLHGLQVPPTSRCRLLLHWVPWSSCGAVVSSVASQQAHPDHLCDVLVCVCVLSQVSPAD